MARQNGAGYTPVLPPWQVPNACEMQAFVFLRCCGMTTAMLHINDLTYRIGGRILFENATVHIPSNQRVGLVGRNGAGKTTLFKLILGDIYADGGSLNIRQRMKVGTVAQETPGNDVKLIDCVLAADEELTAINAELETSQDGHRIAELHERLETIGGHAAPARAGAILAGLGFSAEAQNQTIGEFSGGWQMRVSLAGALFANPDLLLLDEPTNHLDLEATIWLESYLASYQGTLIIISHDRELLNTAVNRIIHLDKTKLVAYTGGYDRFERTRREQMELQAKFLAKQMDQRRKMQAFVDRFRAKASKARQAQSRLKMLERMGPVVSVVEEHSVSFDFPDPDTMSPPLINLEGGVAGYNGNAVLTGLDLRIDMDDRIALLGANGNGKSTLAKILSGRMKLMDGKLTKSSKLKVGYFAQHQTDELHVDGTPLSHMAEIMPMAIESKVRAHLGRFGFGQDRAEVKVGSLSGGEKARLLFALMSRDAPHIMILDEPTNHLDIDSREALVAALNAYDGAVVLISHDPHLIELTADRLWLVDGGGCHAYDGDMKDYRNLLLEKSRTARRGNKEKKKRPKRDKAAERRAAAQARAQLAPLRKAAKEAEAHLEKLNKDRAVLETKMGDPSLYDSAPSDLTSLQQKIGQLDKSIAKAEEKWISAQEAIEQAQS